MRSRPRRRRRCSRRAPAAWRSVPVRRLREKIATALLRAAAAYSEAPSGLIATAPEPTNGADPAQPARRAATTRVVRAVGDAAERTGQLVQRAGAGRARSRRRGGRRERGGGDRQRGGRRQEGDGQTRASRTGEHRGGTLPGSADAASLIRVVGCRLRMHRQSQLFLPTERQPPADAEAISHKLMVRAGLIRQVGSRPVVVAAGRLARAPAGRADRARGDGRDRRPGDADAGARCPPSCGGAPAAMRLDELFKLQDRKGADLVLAMTHEEIVTTHVAQVVRSYRDLPLILYHIQIKERDEPRPRAGVLRTREFIMKDSYSFDRDADGPGGQLRDARRRLRPDLRPRGAGVVPRRVRRGDDGRPGRPRVHGAVPGRRERRRAGARLRGQRRGGQRRAAARAAAARPRHRRAAHAGRDDDRGGRRAARRASRARC